MPLLHATYRNFVEGWGHTYCTANGNVALDVFRSDPSAACTAYVESSGPTAAYRSNGRLADDDGDCACVAMAATSMTRARADATRLILELLLQAQQAGGVVLDQLIQLAIGEALLAQRFEEGRKSLDGHFGASLSEIG